MASLIYLLEANLDRAREITNHPLARKYRIEPVSEIAQLKSFIQKEDPEAIFIGVEWIHSMIDKLNFMLQYPTIVYGKSMEFEVKVRLYKKGALRVLDWTTGGAAMLFNLLRIYFFRHRELKPLIRKNITYGNKTEFHLWEILLNGVYDRQNLIIKILDNHWPAKIRTFQGEIVEAACPKHTGDDAALRILLHQHGQFRMRSFRKQREVSTFSASTLGMIVESTFENREMQKFLGNVGSMNPQFIPGEQNGEKCGPDETRILKMVGDGLKFNSVIRESPFGMLKTIRLLQELLRLNWLKVDESQENLTAFTEEEIDFVRGQLFRPGLNEGRLLVLGLPTSGKSEFVQSLAGVHQSEFKNAQSVDFTRLQLAHDLRLNVFGVAIDEFFHSLMQNLSDGMLGCIFLIDATQTDKIEYTKYLVQQVLVSYQVPYAFAITRSVGEEEKVIPAFRESLQIPADLDISLIDPGDFKQIKQVIQRLKKTSKI